jgi:thioredoxin reductase (NADPH)
VEAILVSPPQLRALIIAEADLGERIVRALILRRVALIETGAGGLVLMARPESPELQRLQNFLARNALPHQVVNAAEDSNAAALIEQYGAALADVLVVTPDGSALFNPTEDVLARSLGMLDSVTHDELFDVTIVRAGPAGLATAVYAASEGLRVVVLPRRSSSVCSLIAALVERNGAQSNKLKHRSMVLESNAYTVLSNSTPSESFA